jgi:NOL1/NOP2/sun family putative RNA methylase
MTSRQTVSAPPLFVRYHDIVDDPAAFEEACRSPLPHFFWTNTLRTTAHKLVQRLQADGFDVRSLPWNPGAYRIPAAQTGLGRHWTYLAGHFQIQEAGAMVPVLVLAPTPGHRVLDLCAAPGNKTVQCAVAMHNHGTVVGNDLVCGRLSPLRQSIDRLGLFNVTITCHDGVNYPPRTGPFDRILVDAPCSCEGTTRRATDASRRRPPPHPRFQHKQTLLLSQAVRRCRVGGRILYSTCTYAPEENEAVLDAVLKQFDGRLRMVPFEVEGLRTTTGLTRWHREVYLPEVAAARRIWPHHNDTGGFFLALLERTGGPEDDPAPAPVGGERPAPGGFQRLSGRRDDVLRAMGDRFGISVEAWNDLLLLENNAQIGFLLIDDHRPPDLAEQTSGLKCVHLRPRYPILTTGAAAAFGPLATRNRIAVTAEQRDAYLRRMPFTPSADQLAYCEGTGYVMVSWQEAVLGVGFYGADQGRIASLFPKSLAING